MKVTVVIQARTGSSRLPGKVVLCAAGAPLLQRMVERVCAARTPSEVVIATTELAADARDLRDRAHAPGVA
jgi:spore coat polysaccharide biosynthesis protein SpsF